MSSEPSLSAISTYHCTACRTLVLSTLRPLSSFAARTSTEDKAFSLPSSGPSPDVAAVQWRMIEPDEAPVVIRLQTGYEKRWLRRCAQCRCVVGYVLAEGEAEGKATYVLPEAVVETEELKKARKR